MPCPEKRSLALPVGIEDRLVDVRGIDFHPGEQRGPKIEADTRVIIDDIA